LRRWLATEGKYGECPQDYALVQAAKYCGVPPWVMAKKGLAWQLKILDYMSAEGEAQKIIADRPPKK